MKLIAQVAYREPDSGFRPSVAPMMHNGCTDQPEHRADRDFPRDPIE